MFLMLVSSPPTSILDGVYSVTQTLQPVSVSLKWAEWKVQSTYRQAPSFLFAVCFYCIFKTHQWKAQSCCFGGCAISLRGAETAKKQRARKSHMVLVPDSSRTAASATTAIATLRPYQEIRENEEERNPNNSEGKQAEVLYRAGWYYWFPAYAKDGAGHSL